MALRSPSGTPRPDLESTPVESSSPISQGGSSGGAGADGAMKKKVDHSFAKLEKEGVEIDGKIASVIYDGMARIQDNVARDNIKDPETKVMVVGNLLAKLEKEGVEIDNNIASIIADEIARIKAEAMRDNINELKKKGLMGGSGNGARADIPRRMKEVKHMLANLEKEGVEIDGKIASIFDDELAKIKAEAGWDNIIVLKKKVLVAVIGISSFISGFLLGADGLKKAFYAEVAEKVLHRKV